MTTYTEAEGRAAIARAIGLPKQTAICRLYAVAMLFFRQPVGNEALDELHRIIGVDATQAMMYVGGMSTTNPSPETWAAVAGIGNLQ